MQYEECGHSEINRRRPCDGLLQCKFRAAWAAVRSDIGCERSPFDSSVQAYAQPEWDLCRNRESNSDSSSVATGAPPFNAWAQKDDILYREDSSERFSFLEEPSAGGQDCTGHRQTLPLERRSGCSPLSGERTCAGENRINRSTLRCGTEPSQPFSMVRMI